MAPLTVEEIAAAVAIVRVDADLGVGARFGPVALVEPDKRDPVAASSQRGRRAELVVYDAGVARSMRLLFH